MRYQNRPRDVSVALARRFGPYAEIIPANQDPRHVPMGPYDGSGGLERPDTARYSTCRAIGRAASWPSGGGGWRANSDTKSRKSRPTRPIGANGANEWYSFFRRTRWYRRSSPYRYYLSLSLAKSYPTPVPRRRYGGFASAALSLRYMARQRRPRGSTGPQWHKVSSDTRFVGVDGLRVEDGHGWSSSGKWRERFSRASSRLSISIFGGLNFSSKFLSISRRH